MTKTSYQYPVLVRCVMCYENPQPYTPKIIPLMDSYPVKLMGWRLNPHEQTVYKVLEDQHVCKVHYQYLTYKPKPNKKKIKEAKKTIDEVTIEQMDTTYPNGKD